LVRSATLKSSLHRIAQAIVGVFVCRARRTLPNLRARLRLVTRAVAGGQQSGPGPNLAPGHDEIFILNSSFAFCVLLKKSAGAHPWWIYAHRLTSPAWFCKQSAERE
jgi:hypothetical protein